MFMKACWWLVLYEKLEATYMATVLKCTFTFANVQYMCLHTRDENKMVTVCSHTILPTIHAWLLENRDPTFMT